jgi:hypothetical protein
MPRAIRTGLMLLIAAALCACGEQTRNLLTASNQVSKQAPATAQDETDKWLGKWTGPEGTFLEITGASSRYLITIRNLDGPRSFEAYGSNHEMTFERDGVTETIRAGTGVQTGMKWLAEKSNCLVVKAGEGYCRTPRKSD